MSVKVFKIDREKVLSRLKSWAEGLGSDENILAVILFGSLPKKEETPASDADVCIILKNSEERFDNRIPHFTPTGIGICVDVFPYTLAEFNSALKENQGIAQEVVKTGIFLYRGKSNNETLP